MDSKIKALAIRDNNPPYCKISASSIKSYLTSGSFHYRLVDTLPLSHADYIAETKRTLFYRFIFAAFGLLFLLLALLAWNAKFTFPFSAFIPGDSLVRWATIVFCLCCSTASFSVIAYLDPFHDLLKKIIRDAIDHLQRSVNSSMDNEKGNTPDEVIDLIQAIEKRTMREYRAIKHLSGLTRQERYRLYSQLLAKTELQIDSLLFT